MANDCSITISDANLLVAVEAFPCSFIYLFICFLANHHLDQCTDMKYYITTLYFMLYIISLISV